MQLCELFFKGFCVKPFVTVLFNGSIRTNVLWTNWLNQKCDIFKYCDYGDLQKSIMLGLESKQVPTLLQLKWGCFLQHCRIWVLVQSETGNSVLGLTTYSSWLPSSICLSDSLKAAQHTQGIDVHDIQVCSFEIQEIMSCILSLLNSV